MASGNKDTTGSVPKLLALPRELRNLIYHFLLVHDTIPIECAVTRISWVDASAQPGLIYNSTYTDLYPLRSSWSRRRTWVIPAFDIGAERTNRKLEAAIRSIHMSYQLPASDIPRMSIAVQVFQVCRQIYEEASEVFYEKNVFSFTDDFRIPTAFAFLCDRPAKSLSKIRSLELALLESSNLRGTNHAHYPDVRRSSDTQVLQYAYNHFTDLCTLISTNRMHLRHLHLIVESSEYSGISVPETLGESLLWEGSRWVDALQPVPWIDPLLKIGNLETLVIHWARGLPRIQQTINTVLSMGQSMLSTASDQTAKTTFDERYENGQDQLVFRMLQLNHNLGSECITPEPGTRGQWKWATYIAEQGLIRNTRDAAHFNTATRSGFQRALIRELVEGYYKAFVWHFKLTAKSRNRLLGVQSGHLLYKSLEK